MAHSTYTTLKEGGRSEEEGGFLRTKNEEHCEVYSVAILATFKAASLASFKGLDCIRLGVESSVMGKEQFESSVKQSSHTRSKGRGAK